MCWFFRDYLGDPPPRCALPPGLSRPFWGGLQWLPRSALSNCILVCPSFILLTRRCSIVSQTLVWFAIIAQCVTYNKFEILPLCQMCQTVQSTGFTANAVAERGYYIVRRKKSCLSSLKSWRETENYKKEWAPTKPIITSCIIFGSTYHTCSAIYKKLSPVVKWYHNPDVVLFGSRKGVLLKPSQIFFRCFG